MKKYFDILSNVALFKGIAPEEFALMRSCMAAETVSYGKGEIVLMAGDRPAFAGVVLSGTLQIVKENYEGIRTLVAHLRPGDYFAEAIYFARVTESPVTVVSDSDAVVMQLNFSHILQTGPDSRELYQKLIENMMEIIAQKNLFLQSRMEIMRIKSVREKVLRYLDSFPLSQDGGNIIEIPLNREEMADYLCVDRSALSHELMKMRRDGIIEYRKNVFKLL